MKLKLIFTAFLLSGILLGICAQEYYIEGFYERHGNGSYTLKDITTQGIKIDGMTNLSGVLKGDKVEIMCDGIPASMVRFSFEKATTDCLTKWDKGFVFQYWDEDNYKWKTDVEACRGQSTGYSQKDMVMMLVLDYSSSMKDNISQIKNYATNFINEISRVSQGNVHIGIIAFSGMNQAKNQVFPITPLTSENKYKFERFIRDSKMGKETALYYSMDTAMQMIEAYVSRMDISKEHYNGACMITFTDGLDNASINDKISITMHRGSKNEYLSYLSNRLSGPSRKKVLGLPLENYAIGFTGSEDFTSDDLTLFRNVLQRTTTDENHFRLSNRFEEVEDYFKYITQQLTERWETLNMYVGESQHGRVRWVLQCGEASRPKTQAQPQPLVSKTRSPWVGISAEFIRYDEPWGGINIEMAFPINQTLAIGGRLGFFALDYVDLDDKGFLLGPEIKITFPSNSAVLVSLGYWTMSGEGIGVLYLRTGYKLKSPWFFTAETLVNVDYEFGFGVGVGYSFGGKQRYR